LQIVTDNSVRFLEPNHQVESAVESSGRSRFIVVNVVALQRGPTMGRNRLGCPTEAGDLECVLPAMYTDAEIPRSLGSLFRRMLPEGHMLESGRETWKLLAIA